MSIFKPVTSRTASRRSFLWKFGAGVSAVASTAVMARPEASTAGDPALKAALLEEEKALRQLHQAFEQAMDRGQYEEVIAMFAPDAQVTFNGRVFDQRHQGVSRLYLGLFKPGKVGRRMEAAPGFESSVRQQDKVEVSADLRSATAEFPYSIQVGVPVESENSLASMARLHGEGVQTWWEGGAYTAAYAKDAVDGRWKISRLEYNTVARADYRAGRSYATPLAMSPLSARYMEDMERMEKSV